MGRAGLEPATEGLPAIRLRTFVEWLVQHAAYPYIKDGVLRQGGADDFIGYLKRYDWDRSSFITMRDYEVDWPYYT